MIRGVLIDLSGTLHIEDIAIKGAVQALEKLRCNNLLIKFVTNTTKESRRILHERLCSLGFSVDINEIHSSLAAARSLIISKALKPMLFLSPEAMEDFEGLGASEDEESNAVVIGLAPTEFHYEKLNTAFRCLLNGAKLIAIHSGKYYKRKDGLALGPGCFVKGLEYSAQCQAELVGKPNRSFFHSAIFENVLPDNIVMIGDDVMDDIKGAMEAGMQGYLVQTGKYMQGDENKISPPPTEICPSFVEAVDLIISKVSQ